MALKTSTSLCYAMLVNNDYQILSDRGEVKLGKHSGSMRTITQYLDWIGLSKV